MKYIEWRDELNGYLVDLPDDERQKILSYFAEMYADKREAGLKESDIISEFGAPYDVARSVLNEKYDEADEEENLPKKRERRKAKGKDKRERGREEKRVRAQGGRKLKKIAILIAVVIIIIGVAALIIRLAANGWRWKVEFEQKTFVSEGEITALDIKTGAGSVRVEYTDGENVEIVYPVSQSFGYAASQTDGTVKLSYNQKWYSFFGIGKMPETVIRIPQEIVPDANLSVAAGTLTLTDCVFAEFNAEVSAGTLTAGKIECNQAKCTLSAGSLIISGFDCASLDVKVSAGSAKISEAVCPDVKIVVSAGSAAVTLSGAQSDYNSAVNVSAGSCNITSQYYQQATGNITVDVSAGSAAINFTD